MRGGGERERVERVYGWDDDDHDDDEDAADAEFAEHA